MMDGEIKKLNKYIAMNYIRVTRNTNQLVMIVIRATRNIVIEVASDKNE